MFMKKMSVFLLGIFTTTLAYSATKNDVLYRGASVEKSLTKNVVLKQILSVSKSEMSTFLPVQCGSQTFYGNCCGQTVTCGWFFVCVNNGVVTYWEYFSACGDPNLCQGFPGYPGCIPGTPA